MKNIQTMDSDTKKLFADHEIEYYVVGYVVDGGNTIVQTQGDATVLAEVIEHITGVSEETVEDMQSRIDDLESEKSDLEDEVRDREREINHLQKQLAAYAD